MYYTYLSYESFSNKKYIGYAKLKPQFDLPIQDPYKGSYTTKEFDPDKKVILSVHATAKEALQMEIILQKRNNVLKDPDFMNRVIYENGFLISEHTEETKKKISEAHKGKKLSPEHRKSLSDAKLGKSLDPLVVEKRKGRKATKETRENMSAAHKGKKKSPSHIENIRKARIGDKNPMYGKEGANKGKKFDDNWRKKLSEAKNPNRYDFINTLTQEIAYNKSASEMMNEKQISKSEIYRLINKKKKILKSGWALHDNQQS
jgi:DNA invertase Pin-like site-specific DNA recombinase